MEEEDEVPDVADLQDEDVDDEQGAGAGEVQNKWNIISITCPIVWKRWEKKVCSKFQVDQYNCNNNAGGETGFFILQIC